MNVLFDSNVYDELVKYGIDKIFFRNLNVSVISTKINVVEHSKIPNDKIEKRYQIQNKVKELEDKNRQVGFFGFADNPYAVGFGDKFHDSNTKGIFFSKDYEDILSESIKHKKDRSLIILSKVYNAVFVTYDKDAFKYANKHNIISILLEHQDDYEFRNVLKRKLKKYMVN
jgi:hypothetical protein